MKKTALVLLSLLPLMATAQVKIPQDANRFTYWQFEYGEKTDTTVITVERTGDVVTIVTPKPNGRLIPGYAQNVTSVDYAADSITVTATYPDSVYYYRTALTRNDIAWRTEDGPRYICSINSNTLAFTMDTSTDLNASPLPHYGLRRGVLTSYTRNGQLRLMLAKAEKVRDKRAAATSSTRIEMQGEWAVVNGNRIDNKGDLMNVPGDEGLRRAIQLGKARRVSPREMDRIMKDHLVVTTRIFDHAQLHWGAENAHFEGQHRKQPSSVLLPADTVVHYAGGTMILKRVTLPDLPDHYQHFVELHQQSNGDAYDRTGSIFIVTSDGYVAHNFFDGINWHPDSLPTFIGRDGQRYQGMMATRNYRPPLEWVRFFTPFGVGHFNERMQGYGVDWRDEAFYRQEITDVYCGGDVIVGAWIGNYDGGGHLLTLDVKSYPNDNTMPRNYEEEATDNVVPLFNTCNVLEMAGQNYGKLFATDSLTVTFTVPADAKGARLRYISTGHGGWGEGDEFVPKQNTILIDGHPAFIHTPWRSDCGCYRDLNPVSGNFWNGLSSSDFSRSGWCPGTAAQPVYFDLTPWADGKQHTITVAIPQGKPVEGMFSHWAVSGALIIEQ